MTDRNLFGIDGEFPRRPGLKRPLLPDYTDFEEAKIDNYWGIGLPAVFCDGPKKVYRAFMRSAGFKPDEDETNGAKKTKGTEPVPKPKEGGASFYRALDDYEPYKIDWSRISSDVYKQYAAKMLINDLNKDGCRTHYLSLKDINEMFPHSYVIDGYECGGDIYFATYDGLFHEAGAKDAEAQNPEKTHYELHPETNRIAKKKMHKYESLACIKAVMN